MLFSLGRQFYRSTLYNNTFLKEEFIEMTDDPEAKSMHTFKGIGYNWMKEQLYQIISSLVKM